MPNKGKFFYWLAADKTLADQYAKAREAQAEFMADEIMNIADDGTNDWMEQKAPDGMTAGYKFNGEAVSRSRLRVDARKWVASKLLPKKYGEKIDHAVSGPDGGPVEYIIRDMTAKEGK
jgi:hypothetical protein